MGAHSVSRDRSPCKLVVLSNGDPGMLEAAKQYHNIHFDKGISVVEANSLKPHRATYTKAAEISGLEPSRIFSSSRTMHSIAPALNRRITLSLIRATGTTEVAR